MGPRIDIDVIAPVDLRGLATLIKPAVLYGDRVRIHSPAAALLHGVTQFADLTDPADQLAAIVQVAQQAPSALGVDFDLSAASGLEAFLRMTPRERRTIARLSNATAEVQEMERMIGGLREIWERDMPRAIDQILETTGGGDLIDAVRAGAVEVSPLGALGATDHVVNSVVAASETGRAQELDPVLDGFLEAIVDTISAPGRFPLLDADAAALVQSMEREALVAFDPSTAARSSEIHGAARFMAFLPSFPDLALSEVLDLKKELEAPLLRFRAEMAALSKEFSRPIDERFALEVEDAWRERVAPALAEIRETLAEHGLLREVASVAQGDLKAIFAEAGGVVVTSHLDLLRLSGLMTLGVATAIPSLHILGKAVNQRLIAERQVRKQGFYFLHKVDVAARRR